MNALTRRSEAATVGAFFRLEGAVAPVTSAQAAAYIAASAPSVRQRVVGRAMAALGAGLGLATPLKDPRTGARIAWSSVRGLTRDRVEVLSSDFARDVVLPRVNDDARRLIDHARRDSVRLFLVSDGLDVAALDVARALGIDDVIANSLVFDSDEATGELRAPILGPDVDASRIASIARERGVDLARSSAYGASAGDSMLLSHVARPCALAPDRELARIARDLGWPVVGSASSDSTPRDGEMRKAAR